MRLGDKCLTTIGSFDLDPDRFLTTILYDTEPQE